jgi:catechol 2,3-dioxygenase-like lactoylglutathione lyase family enzyme
MVQGFHHVAVQCAELEACERFYRDVLGLPVVQRRSGASGQVRSVWLGLGGGSFLALEPAGEPPGDRPWSGPRAGLHLLAFRIEAGGRAGWEAKLAAAGVEVVRRTRWTIYLRDPEGNRIGLSHHPEEAP